MGESFRNKLRKPLPQSIYIRETEEGLGLKSEFSRLWGLLYESANPILTLAGSDSLAVHKNRPNDYLAVGRK